MTDSGLTIDGIAVPLAIEAAGGAAIDAHVLEQLTAPDTTPDGAPPTTDEGDE